MASKNPSCAPQELIIRFPADPPAKPPWNKKPVRPWQTCTKEEIKEYRKFPILYGERKFAQLFPKEKQTLSFTDDLPPELRLLIYDHLFNTPAYFELWAPWKLTKQGSRCKNQFNTYASKKKALKIMRLSKKVHKEATAHFYSRTNFRFSTYNGFAAMAVFNHNLGRGNCELIRHITVQIPNREDLASSQGSQSCMWYMSEWHAFVDIHRNKRGMRIPDFGYRRRHSEQGRILGEFNYNKAVLLGHRQLRAMASLRALEILIPWDYRFITVLGWRKHCKCKTKAMREGATPEVVVRHCVKEHSCNPEYWTLLEDLKRETASEDLTISLVLVYGPSWRIAQPDSRDFPLQGRWLAAYASVMGYRFGHAMWAKDKSTYVVRYDKNELLSVAPDQAEHKAKFEPPKLT
ncbi:hypothetical protein DHEL01_v205134 [Diaporthe helianthi]|uniref:F-box domain-containing protein n=1 Tax=Diaporthe helianthi TaxID=158607 RepID=A0A2P5I1T3_DIAHE|nr:hypothetical protein DHEL01_v205134 [Diaporthe helianthi]